MVVAGGADAAAVGRCLASLRAQTLAPTAVRVVSGAGEDAPLPAPATDEWPVVSCHGRPLEEAVMATGAALAASAGATAGVLFVDGDVTLEPGCLAACAAVLAGDARVGVVSGWLAEADAANVLHVPPNPARPHVWDDDHASPCLVVRVEALMAAAAPSRRRAAHAAGQAGWAAVTVPRVLGTMAAGLARSRRRGPPVRFSSMAGAVQRLHTPLLQWLRTCSPADRRAFVADGMRSPGRSVRWLAGRAVRAWRVIPTPSAVSSGPRSDADDEGRRNAARRAN